MILLVLLPLLFISNRSSHDWGDDFAQYIHQTANLLQGIPQAETGFIHSSVNNIGPRAYPPGFPMLLAPVYAIAGNRMQAFTFLMSIIYFFVVFMLLKYFRNTFSAVPAIMLAAIWAYNPQMLNFKQEVMSDLPFTAVLLLLFLLYPKLKKENMLAITGYGLLAGFLIMIRSIGIMFVTALLLMTVYQWIKNKKSIPGTVSPPLHFGITGIVSAIALATWFVFNRLVFKLPGGSMSDYLQFYYSGDFISAIFVNLRQYMEVFRYMYVPASGPLGFLSLLLGASALTLASFGFIAKLKKGPELPDMFFMAYVFALLVYPYQNSAFRFMVPIGFILLEYMAVGLKQISLFAQMGTLKKSLVFGLPVIVLFLPGIIEVAKARNTILEGPQQPAAREAFEYIRNHVPEDSIVSFPKPRALALYAQCKTSTDPFTSNPVEIHVQLVNAHVAYILVNNILTGDNIKRYIKSMNKRAEKVWSNKSFELYKLRLTNPLAQP